MLGASGCGGSAGVHCVGRRVAVELDLEKFFGRVNHVIPMGPAAEWGSDSPVMRFTKGLFGVGRSQTAWRFPPTVGTGWIPRAVLAASGDPS